VLLELARPRSDVRRPAYRPGQPAVNSDRPGRIRAMQRTAIVTGASSGIGAATAERLAATGFHVVLAARRLDRLGTVAADIADAGGSSQVNELDVTERTQVDALADSVSGCDVLVCNAG